MKIFRRLTKPVSHLVIFGLLALSMHFPAAQAGLVGTEAVINASQTQQQRQHLQQVLNRADVKAALIARGVEPAQVQARIDSLNDQEIQSLSTHIDQLPAGGDSLLGVLVFIFVVLLITDILGFTNVFPFVKHPRR
ncbi:MAG: PA2779 family protein [Gammaproteobacteria bacterium]|nr:PA2779 family protein [Gammaproteobacteria bacterium]